MDASETAVPRVFTFMSQGIAEAEWLESGHFRTGITLPGTEALSSRIKVYVSGGENEMHSHPKEDHAFYILGGQATFHIDSDENMVDVGPNQAVLIPRGTKYWFTSTGMSNLVLLRVGSGKDAYYRLDEYGNEIIEPDPEKRRRDDGRSLVQNAISK